MIQQTSLELTFEIDPIQTSFCVMEILFLSFQQVIIDMMSSKAPQNVERTRAPRDGLQIGDGEFVTAVSPEIVVGILVADVQAISQSIHCGVKVRLQSHGGIGGFSERLGLPAPV